MKTEIIIVLLLIGLIYCSTHKHSDVVETFTGSNECPNILVQKGDKLMLLNTKKAKVPGINPILFDNLEEYTEFIQWQQAMKIKCPILYFQQTYTTQGEKGFRMLPDPVEKQAGLPSTHMAQRQPLYDATHDDPPYNKNSYAGADPTDQNIGVYTPLDKLYHSKKQTSDNPMDKNWHGSVKTTDNIAKGIYDKDHRPDIGIGSSLTKLGQEGGGGRAQSKAIMEAKEKEYKRDYGTGKKVGGHTIYGTKATLSKSVLRHQNEMLLAQQQSERSAEINPKSHRYK